MFYCNNCNHEFDDPVNQYVSAESYYGVDSLLDERTVKLIQLCPHCDSEEIEEMSRCDVCGEYCRFDDLVDTTEYAGGGIGDICPQCMEDCEVGM